MNLRVHFEAEVEVEYLQALRWHERQREGLGVASVRMPPAPATLLPRDEMLLAFMASDASYEGIFYTAVRTTGIFCRPTCSAREPKPENVDVYRSADDALAAGFRPCKRCRAFEVADAPDWV